jgi:hypothetical protein
VYLDDLNGLRRRCWMRCGDSFISAFLGMGPRVPYLVSLPDAARLLTLLVVVNKGPSNTVDTLFLLSLASFNPFCVC